jgi:hypothetical protein
MKKKYYYAMHDLEKYVFPKSPSKTLQDKENVYEEIDETIIYSFNEENNFDHSISQIDLNYLQKTRNNSIDKTEKIPSSNSFEPSQITSKESFIKGLKHLKHNRKRLVIFLIVLFTVLFVIVLAVIFIVLGVASKKQLVIFFL